MYVRLWHVLQTMIVCLLADYVPVVLNAATQDNFIWSQAKSKSSFPQYPLLTKKDGQKGYNGNEGLCFSNLTLLYDSWTLLYDLKHFYAFLYTLIWSWALLYNPVLNRNSCNTHFNHKKIVKNGCYGNDVF